MVLYFVKSLLLDSFGLALVISLFPPDFFDAFVNLVVMVNELLVSGLKLSDVPDFVVDL